MAISIFVNYIFTILIGMYIGFSVNLNPKNGLINGLLAGLILQVPSILYLKWNVHIHGLCGTPFEVVAALVNIYFTVRNWRGS